MNHKLNFEELPRAVEELIGKVDNLQRGIDELRNANTPKPNNDELIDVEEAAKILNLAVSTIYTYVRERRIPFYKPGKQLLFKRQELLGWLTNQRKGNNEDVQAISRGISRRPKSPWQ